MRKYIIILILMSFLNTQQTYANQFVLTDDELAYIAQHPIVSIGIDPEFAPYEFIDAQGAYLGITADYLRLIEEKTGLEFDRKVVSNWTEVYELALEGKIDLLPCVGVTKERKGDFLLTSSYQNFQRVLLSNNESVNHQFETLNEIGDKTFLKIGVQKNSSHYQFLTSEVDTSLISYDSNEEMLLALSVNEIQLAVGNYASTRYLIKQLGLSNIQIDDVYEDVTLELCMAITNDNVKLQSILDKALSSISEEERVAISNKWLGIEQKADYTGIMTIGLIATILVVLVIGSFTFWNIRLRNEIALRYEIERELVHAKGEAEQANQAKSMFLANMSHEIRTPMNAIIGLGQLLEQTELSVKQSDYITKINSASNHLLGIINDILDFSKIESGRLLMEVVPFSLNEIIMTLSNVVALGANKKGLELLIHHDKNIPERLLGDSLRLYQILFNLMDNAVKFTESGKIILAISLKEEHDNLVKIQFEVTDTGIGMSDEQIANLFEAFSQADISTTRKYGGTGLGLSIVKNYITMLDGNLSIESEVNQGSTLVITIPFELDSSKPEENIEEISLDGVNNVTEKGLLEGVNLLVVEDNLINQQIAEENLTLQGANVDIANNGVEALDMIEQNHYDLILMDLQMPVMGGIDATIEIRKKYSAEKLPIIALTADIQKNTQKKIKAVGMQAHVSKPINLSYLYRILAEVLNIDVSMDDVSKESFKVTEVKDPKALALSMGLKTFDVETGLRRLNDNSALYLKIIGQFYDSYADFSKRIVSVDYQEDLIREFHTLKGLSASLGNEQISKNAKIMEYKLRANEITKDDFSKESAFNAVLELLHESLIEITTYIEGIDINDAPLVIDEVLTDESFSRELETLKMMLESYDIEAQEKIKSVRGNFIKNGWLELYTKVQTATEVYDYKTALEVIEDLLN